MALPARNPEEASLAEIARGLGQVEALAEENRESIEHIEADLANKRAFVSAIFKHPLTLLLISLVLIPLMVTAYTNIRDRNDVSKLSQSIQQRCSKAYEELVNAYNLGEYTRHEFTQERSQLASFGCDLPLAPARSP